MKQYLLFGKKGFEGTYGWNSLMGSYETVDEAKRVANTTDYSQSHVVDLKTEKIVLVRMGSNWTGGVKWITPKDIHKPVQEKTKVVTRKKKGE